MVKAERGFRQIYGCHTLVGSKNASLGEMIGQLAPKGVNVPNGFAEVRVLEMESRLPLGAATSTICRSLN
jgi:Pyruvate phosphate dikinase, AMP/ATP-binding domain